MQHTQLIQLVNYLDTHLKWLIIKMGVQLSVNDTRDAINAVQEFFNR